MNLYATAQLLVLLSIANGAPVFAKWLMGMRCAYPLDGGAKLADGQRLFGPSKTLRGVVLAIAATSALSPFIGLPWPAGATIAGGAMVGDLLSSFVKRRLNLAPSSMALGIDQIPESVLPAILAKSFIPLTGLDILFTAIVFFGGELAASRILFALRIRDRPY